MDFRRIASALAPWSPLVEILFNSSAGVLNDQSLYGASEIKAASYPAYKTFAAYIQDELKASQRLNLSLGLRWEVDPPPDSTNGPLPYIVVGNASVPSSLSLAPEGNSFWQTTYYNFAPRIGLAYSANNKHGSETVIRAGGGVFFDAGQQQSTQSFVNGIGNVAEALYFGASYPLTPAQVNVPSTNPLAAPYKAEGYYYPQHTQLPYTWQWNLSLEQALGAAQTFTLSYVGSNGRRLLSQQELATASAFPLGVLIQSSDTTSSYNALQLKFQRTVSRGLQLLASYNWAHSIDFGSQDVAFAQIRGNSDFDIRDNFNLAATYEAPKAKSGELIDAIVNQWSFDTRFAVRGGFPVILDGNAITLSNGQEAFQGLDLVPNTPIYLRLPGLPGGREVNPAAFSLPTGTAYGDAPRNFVRGFGMNELDLGIRRTFPLVDRLNLQFRAEVFNLLNHPNFGYIEPLYGNPRFGQATKTLNESLTNLNSLYQQGGPRSIQLSLRLEF
ncbi:TonB-dependent receptor [Acidisarcina polymorpha]|uniref:TonB-dependent receptor n=1 Tax=Acidisarcina polymorpha TaxID=2211140 RepID=UPI001F308F4E|nr:TonB-dependent receptor [Acidisarcina polymorpha]